MFLRRRARLSSVNIWLFVVCAAVSAAALLLPLIHGGETVRAGDGTGQPQRPVAVPDAYPRQGGIPLLVHFFDGGSYDPDGDIVRWEWNFHEGAGGWEDFTATGGEAWCLYDVAGTRAIQLRVTDNEGHRDIAILRIEMRQGNNANPVAVASADPVVGTAQLPVIFRATDSYDPDGVIVTYEWDFGQGAGFEEVPDGEAAHTYTTAGSYTAVLRVTDDDGAMSTDLVEVLVHHPLTGSPWPMRGHDERHTHRSPFVGPQTNNVKWSLQMGVSVSCPVIAEDGTIYIGSQDGNAYAIDPSGYVKWTYPTGGYIRAAPAVADSGTVYVHSTDGYLYALRPDGTLDWKSHMSNDTRWCSPTIGSDGTIYVGDLEYGMMAYRPDGTRLWTHAAQWPLSAPAIGADGTLYFGEYWGWSVGGYIRAVNPDGSLRWSYFTYPGGTTSPPSVGDDGTVFLGWWRHPYPPYDDYVVALTPGGSLKWQTRVGRVAGSPALGQDGTVYVCSYDFNFYALDPANGSIRWTFPTGNVMWHSPAVGADGTVYFGSGDGFVYALDPDGTLKWSYDTESYVYSSPAIGADGTLYVVTSEGTFYAFGP